VRNARRILSATVLVTGLAAMTAACSSPGSPASSTGQETTAKPAPSQSAPVQSTPAQSTPASSTPAPVSGTGPFAGLTADQVAARALADTKAAPVVRITGTGSDSGQTLTLDVTLVRGKGCQGTISEGTAGSFRLVYNGTTVWVLPDSKFYQSNGVPAAAQAILDGKYLQVKSTDTGLGAIANLCSVSSLLGGFGTKPTGLVISTPVTFDDMPAVKLSDIFDSAYVYVSYTARPVLLRLTDPTSGGGKLDFSYNSTATITPPPASEVIDGSKYGF
jgi:hypothetical protein